MMTVGQTRAKSSGSGEYKYKYTDSDVVLDGFTLYGYEDYMNGNYS